MADPGTLNRFKHRAARFFNVAPVDVAPTRGIFSLSFDDFPVSSWTEGGRVMADHGVRGTYYVAGGLCGGQNLDLPQFEVSHMEAAVEAGHELGCHTFEHVSVLKLSAAALNDSLDRNAQWVAERIPGYQMQTFAYPFGDWSVEAKRVISRRFAVGRGVRKGLNARRADRAGLLAIGLEVRLLPDFDLEALAAEAAATNAWLVAYGHDVSDSPTPYGCRVQDLERMILAARKAGLEILPMAEAAAKIGAVRG